MNTSAPSVETILAQAVEIVEPAERQAFVEQACSGDKELRDRLERLIANHFQAGSFLERPMVVEDPERTAGWEAAGSAEGPGTVIGPYKLLEQIGEGGMGIVYVAEQSKPMRRKVALKVIKPGMDTKQVIARFEAERQALALMDHPNIARVLDAGATESGRPYFVMELVRGIPITEYCDRERLSISERLELFVLVCRAVQHAHQKAVIHRDLKPSNILVTVIDGVAVPKVIDFGVAKATGQALTERTLFTGFHQFVGTPLYMSPEQADLAGVDVDTRSDIYSLGVLLYELLTGTTPFDQETFRRAAYDEMRRMIREDEPPKPSTRLGAVATTLIIASTYRRTEPRKLLHAVCGELDWIVMRALEKDRRRRYETAGTFAADVKRFLAEQPVEAGPPSPWYRFRKFVRRNRVALTAAVLVCLTLIAGIAVSAWQSVRAFRAERESGRQSLLARAAAETVRDREVNLRHQAEDFAEQSRRRQVQLSIENGTRLMDAGDLAGSLPWYVEALRLDGADPAQAEIHRIRLAATLAQCVKPARIWANDQPSGAEFRPDGRAVAVFSWDGTVTVWSIVTGEALGPTLRHTDRVTNASFSPDGRRIATSSHDRTARIWDIASGREVVPPLNHEGKVFWAEFSPDGSRVATSCATPTGQVPQICHLWDAATGQPVTPPFAGGLPAFSSDGRFLATSDAHARLYHARTGKLLEPGLPPDAIAGRVHPRIFNPDGQRVATTGGNPGNRKVRIWDISTGKLALPPLDLLSVPMGAEFSPDGRRLLTRTIQGTVQIWDAATGVPSVPPLEHEGDVVASFSPDSSRMVTTCVNGATRVRNAATGRLLFPPMRHQERTWMANFNADGRYLLSNGQHRMQHLWDLGTASPASLWLPHISAANAASFSPDGRMLATQDNDEIRLWDAATGVLLGPSLAHSGGFVAISRFSSDGRFITAMSTGETAGHVDAYVWDVATRKPVTGPLRHQFRRPVAGILDSIAIWSTDGRRIATATGAKDATGIIASQARIWEVKTGAAVSPAIAVDFPILDLQYSPDGRSAAIAGGFIDELGRGGEARILNVETGTLRFPPIQTPEACQSLRFSPDGSFLVTASGTWWVTGAEARVWDATTGQPATPPLRHTGSVNSARFSPDGQLILTGSSDGTAQIWDSRTGSRILAPLRHKYRVYTAEFSPDGRFVLTTSSAGPYLDETRAYAQVWDATSGQPLTPPLWHTRNITSAAFAPDSRRFATTTYGEGAQIWSLKADSRPLADWVRLAQVISETRLDSDGTMRAMEPSELRETHDALRRQDPAPFTTSGDQILSSHYHEALACESAGNWKAALGHLNVLIGAGRGIEILRHHRARAHAELDNWREAAADYRSLLSAGDWYYDRYSLALLELGQSDPEGYRAACATMLRSFGKAESSGQPAEFTAWGCALGPHAIDDYGPAITLAERLRAAQPKSQMSASALGALHFRAGRFNDAVARLTEAELLEKDLRSSPVYTWFFLAMAHHRLGHAAEAKTWRDKAQAATEQVLADHAKGTGEPLSWRRRLTLKLLRQEVEALIPASPSDTKPR